MKATFFVVGENAAEYPEILKRAAREGHEIANHSWSHPNLGKMADEAVRRELQKTDDAIKSAIGTRPTLMRPPYGSITARQKNWIHDDVWLPHHHLGRRSARLETTGAEPWLRIAS